MRQLSIQVTIGKVNHYRSMCGSQQGALAHIEQKAINLTGPKMDKCKTTQAGKPTVYKSI